MASKSESKPSTITYQLKQPERCSVCRDMQILVNYMGFEICPFCAAGEKEETEEEEEKPMELY